MSRRISKEDLDAFVRMMEGGADVTLAARTLNVSPSALYARMAKSTDLKERVQNARRVADERVEASLYRVATRTQTLTPRCYQHGPTHHPAAICPECHQGVTVQVPDADVRAIQFWLTNRQRDKWKQRWTVENVVPHDAVLMFVRAISEAIQQHVLDVELKRRLAEAIELAGANLERGATVH